MQTKAQRDFDEVFDEAEHIYSEPIYDTPSKGKYATPTKVAFIYYVSTCIAQNLIQPPIFFTKTVFFCQNKRISFSTIHFDEIFVR